MCALNAIEIEDIIQNNVISLNKKTSIRHSKNVLFVFRMGKVIHYWHLMCVQCNVNNGVIFNNILLFKFLFRLMTFYYLNIGEPLCVCCNIKGRNDTFIYSK